MNPNQPTLRVLVLAAVLLLRNCTSLDMPTNSWSCPHRAPPAGKMFVQVLKPGYPLRPETSATSEVPSAEADFIAQMPGGAGHFTRDTKHVPPVGSCNLSAASDVLLSYLLATSTNYRNSGGPLRRQASALSCKGTSLDSQPDLTRRIPRPNSTAPAGQVGQVRSSPSQAGIVTRPESRATRVSLCYLRSNVT
jgi:hypothetical protein